MGILDRWKARRRGMPAAHWVFVSFNLAGITLTLAPPGEPSRQQQFAWASIREATSDDAGGWLQLRRTSAPTRVDIPLDAAGGSALFDELRRRNLLVSADATDDADIDPEPSTGGIARALYRLLLVAVIAGIAYQAYHAKGQRRDHQVRDHAPITGEQWKELRDMPAPRGRPFPANTLMRTPGVHYYNVMASSGAGLEAQIRELGPSEICGFPCATSFHWNLLWKWEDIEQDGVCAMDWANVVVTIDYQVPLWLNEREAPAPFRARYSEWMAQVWEQLNDRTRVVVDEAALLEMRLNAMPPMICDDLDRAIKADGFSTIEKIKQRTAALGVNPGARDWMRDY